MKAIYRLRKYGVGHPFRWMLKQLSSKWYCVIRDRSLRSKDDLRSTQYHFEESCLESLYNETQPDDPFDSVSPFWVVPNSIRLAERLGIPVETVMTALHTDA